MNPRHTDLLRRLEAFHIGPADAALSFAARLARENSWPADYAARVVAEYKRFVFLLVEAGHPVTPSEAVDQAWHLHMVYTRSYWDGLCAGVVGKPLHHSPTAGGDAEGRKFEDWYARTLDTYAALFGHPPPADIWPPIAERFRGPAPRWIDPAHYWLVPKSRVRRTVLGVGLAATTIISGCSLAMNKPGSLSRGFTILIGIVGVLFIIAWLIRKASCHSTSSGSGGCGGGFAGCGGAGHDGGDSGGGGCGDGGGSGCGGGGCGGGGD